MATDQEQAMRAWLASGEAMRLHLAPRSVAVVCFGSRGPETIGSGTCVAIAGRWFVATAAHVVDGYPISQITLAHTLAPSNVQVPIIGSGSKGGGTINDLTDLAWLEIREDAARALGKEFVPLDRIALNPPSEPINVAVYGYPYRAYPRDGQLQVTSFTYSTITMAPADFPANRDAVSNILFEMPRESNLTVTGEAFSTMPSPRGLSGGGMWDMDINRLGLWSAGKAKLIGIQRTADPENAWLRGTPFRFWLQLLRRDIPSLTRPIDEHLRSGRHAA